MPRKYLTPAEVAEITSYSAPTVYRLLEQGKMPGIQVEAGGRWIINPESLDRWLQGHERGGNAHLSRVEVDDASDQPTRLTALR